jgi:hypothetical protein
MRAAVCFVLGFLLAVIPAANVTRRNLLPSPGQPNSELGCPGQDGFLYAGLLGSRPVRALAAMIRVLAGPTQIDGHIAGWINVGRNNTEWLQAGLASFNAESNARLYYETNINGHPDYHELDNSVETDSAHTFVLVERQPGLWLVRIDGKARATVRLSGKPVFASAFGESWSDVATCNDFSYLFSHARVLRPGDSAWHALGGEVTRDSGYQVVLLDSAPTRFIARSKPGGVQ